MQQNVAKVVVEIRTKSLNRAFDYLIPDSLASQTQKGHRVLVSFGRQMCQGYVVDIVQAPVDETGRRKPILTLLDETPLLSEEMLRLCEWMTDRYVCTMLEAIRVVLPGAFRTQAKQRYKRTESAEHLVTEDDSGVSVEMKRFVQSFEKRPLSFKQLTARLGEKALLQLPQALALGLVEEVTHQKDRVGDKFETYVESELSLAELEAAATLRERRAPKQAGVVRRYIELFETAEEVSVSDMGVRPSDPAVTALVRDEVIRLVENQVFRDEEWLKQLTEGGSQDRPPLPELTSWQERALQVIRQAMADATKEQVLLHGVTGSGKTEVYMRAIESCLTAGRRAIVLVPEISLTPQMVHRFTSRFGTLVSVLHSGLSAGERKDAFVRIRQGAAKVVIGARSAVFAPMDDLCLVIVDEEHEPSYKQEETPFYDAREVALWRARYHHGTVLSGSATPSLEAMTKVESGQAVLAMLPERVTQNPMPSVEIIDMRDELKAGNRSLFSEALTSGLEDCIREGHQAILFLNRRGYSAFMLCRSCGERILCPNCDISLTLHRGRHGDFLRCHYCQYTSEAPDVCPTCLEPAMRPFGIGTQQVEEHLHERWPDWRVLRMDVDTTRKKGAHHDLIRRFEGGDADVLLGTQMVAKGLDFPNVAFVGVISADTMLAVPDYRANERTFNLLTQVAGRAGRGATDGLTVIQTYQPDHYAIMAAAHHDYGAFYRRERATREAFGYPPFRELALFLATHEESRLAQGAAQRFERELRRRLSPEDAVILPASPSGIGRVENRYRYQVVVKYSQWEMVKSVVQSAYAVVTEKMIRLGGSSVLDVGAGRI